MPDKPQIDGGIPQITASNTKQEMLAAYAVKALEGPGTLRIVPPLAPGDRQRGTGQTES